MPLWLGTKPLVLASKSAARRALLNNAGIPAEIWPAEIDERAIETEGVADGPEAVAALLARAKAREVARQLPGRIVLGADQTLALGRQRFSKPPDRPAAAAQLRALRGKTHALHSALAVALDGNLIFQHSGTARLTMRAFSEQFLQAYLDTAKEAVTASVGAYQLEGLGIHLFERIDGDYFTILGLSLPPLLDFLRREKLLSG
jgi:septum formation protein